MCRKTLRELYDENIRVLADFVGADPKNLGIQDYSFRIKIVFVINIICEYDGRG